MSKLSYEATHCRRLWVRAKELSLGSPKRGLIEVSFFKRESAKDSTPYCSASCFKEVSPGPAGRCWFIPCACLFFYKHSCCIKWPPGLNFCPLPGVLRHGRALTSFTQFPVGNMGAQVPILYARLENLLDTFHLSILNLKIHGGKFSSPSLQ